MRNHNIIVPIFQYNSSVLHFFKKNFSLYKTLIPYIFKVFEKHITKIVVYDYELLLYTNINSVQYILSFLKLHSFFKINSLSDIAVIDFPGNIMRFQIQYLLLSITFNTRIRIIIETNEIIPVFSITSIFAGANWYEREVWDMFGIFFQEHPDLRRILTDYGFKGHPLRKDFPLSGYIEVFYDDTKKAIVYVPVSLAQDFRNFNFKNPWIKN